MLFNRFPYTDAHELNLDFLLNGIKALGADVKELSRLLEESTGNITDRLEIIEEWIRNYNDSFMREEIAKFISTMIFVEISDAGYVMYYIPDTWEEIIFNTTDLDISIPDVDYGHLVLSY